MKQVSVQQNPNSYNGNPKCIDLINIRFNFICYFKKMIYCTLMTIYWNFKYSLVFWTLFTLKYPFSGNWYNRNLKIKKFQIHFKSITRNLHVCTNALLHHMSKSFLKNETLSVKLSTIKCKQYSTKLLTYKKVLFGSWMYRYLHTRYVL